MVKILTELEVPATVTHVCQNCHVQLVKLVLNVPMMLKQLLVEDGEPWNRTNVALIEVLVKLKKGWVKLDGVNIVPRPDDPNKVIPVEVILMGFTSV